MNTPVVQRLYQHFLSGMTPTQSVMFGGSLAYAVPNGYWHHTPLILLNPFAYTAYQAFVSQELIIVWAKRAVLR
jgi:hypothetical protein